MSSNALDDLLPIREILNAGTVLAFAAKLDFASGFTITTTQDTDPTTGLPVVTMHVTAVGAVAAHIGALGMRDANFAVAETSGEVYVGSDTAFAADRTLTLPAAPGTMMRVTWADECVTANGSLAAHDLVIDGNGKNIQAGGTGGTGGNITAATYRAQFGAWGAGAAIELVFNGTMWKVV